MRVFSCRIRKDRVAAFKATWSHPQNIENWAVDIEASDETEACQTALSKLQPISTRNLQSAKQAVTLNESWVTCSDVSNKLDV